MDPRVDVTVAAIIERNESFLVVEETCRGELVFNQPAGHLEPGESLLDAVIRETFEETGFAFAPAALVGIYLWHSGSAGRSFLRVSFTGAAEPPGEAPRLDDGIVATHWLNRGQLLQRERKLRSPMVLRCIDDYRAGARFPLDCLTHLDPALAAGVRSA